MIKKGLYLLLSYIVIISVLSSCSSSNKTTYPPTARDVVNTILRKLTEGDISNILKYCDEDSAVYEHFNKITESSLVDAFATSFATTPENQGLYRNSDYIKNWFQVLTKNMYKDYQIIDFNDNDDYAEYNVSISSIDYSSIEFFSSTIFYNMLNDFYNQHPDLIDSIEDDDLEEVDEQKFELLFVQMFKNMGKEMFSEYSSQIKNQATYSSSSYIIKLAKKEGKWKVTHWDKE